MILKLGEDRESEGLMGMLGAIGLGGRSPFSVNFRLYCRSIGTFIATRTRDIPGFEKLNETLGFLFLFFLSSFPSC